VCAQVARVERRIRAGELVEVEQREGIALVQQLTIVQIAMRGHRLDFSKEAQPDRRVRTPASSAGPTRQ